MDTDIRDPWILDEIVIRGHLDHGSHPERYIKYRTTRARPFRRYKRKPPPTSILPSMASSVTSSVRRYWNQPPQVPYHHITEAEVQRELEQIFHIRERIIDAFQRLKKEHPQLWLKKGWRGYYVPIGYRYPVTPKPRRVTLGYLTAFQHGIKNKYEAAKKAAGAPAFWSEDWIRPRWRKLKYWLIEYFPPFHHYAPITFARVSDFNEEGEFTEKATKFMKDEVDPSRKHYEPIKNRPDRKKRIPSLYDDCAHSILAKYLNLRRYRMDYGDRYRYISAFLMDRRVYRGWTIKSIEMLRRHFEVHDPLLTGFVTYDDMCKMLDVFGIKSSDADRKREFNAFVHMDFPSQLTPPGQIEFEEFLRVFYILKYRIPAKEPDAKEKRIRIQMGVRRNTPAHHDPWVNLKRKKKPKDIRTIPLSFRNGRQCPAVAVGSSVYWNLASGMF